MPRFLSVRFRVQRVERGRSEWNQENNHCNLLRGSPRQRKLPPVAAPNRDAPLFSASCTTALRAGCRHGTAVPSTTRSAPAGHPASPHDLRPAPLALPWAKQTALKSTPLPAGEGARTVRLLGFGTVGIRRGTRKAVATPTDGVQVPPLHRHPPLLAVEAPRATRRRTSSERGWCRRRAGGHPHLKKRTNAPK